jgi:hypothetical protein
MPIVPFDEVCNTCPVNIIQLLLNVTAAIIWLSSGHSTFSVTPAWKSSYEATTSPFLL